MTKGQRLKATIAVAKILGLTWAEIDGICRVEYTRGNMVFRGAIFDIFTSPADCLAVAKKLGELYQVSFYFIRNEGWGAVDYYDSPMFDDIYSTLEEAVGAACLEIEVEAT